jgi:hypothetical protein
MKKIGRMEEKLATENTEDTEFFFSVLSVFSVAKKEKGR